MTNKKSGMKAAEERLDFFTAHQLLSYDPLTGLIYRKTSTRMQKAGQQTGGITSCGYATVHLKGYGTLYAHRLAFLMMTGSWPKNIVDHKNHLPADNRWSNLRDVTFAENNHFSTLRKDNSSGCRNVQKLKNGKFLAYLHYNKVRYHVGTFKTLEEAMLAVKDKRKDLRIELDDVSSVKSPDQK